MKLIVTYQFENDARKFREIMQEYCPSIRYFGAQKEGDYVYELTTNYEDADTINHFLKLFYWMGKHRNHPLPDHFKIED